MSRQTLIISNPGERGDEHYCAGVNKDVELYTSFLTSSIGGAWYRSEIMALSRPSKSEVRSAMRAVKQADYSLVIFCGHGGMDSFHGPTILELRHGENLNADELKEDTSKRTIILDCCREVRRPSVLAKSMEVLDEAIKAVSIDRTECRKFYDYAIQDCPNGLVILYGCSVDERAGDDAARGGLYSSILVEESISWARNLKIDTSEYYQVRSVVSAHQSAEEAVSRISGGLQHPTIQKPRSGKYFPFGIVA